VRGVSQTKTGNGQAASNPTANNNADEVGSEARESADTTSDLSVADSVSQSTPSTVAGNLTIADPGPKKPGIKRVGVVIPKVDSTEAAQGVQEKIIAALSGPALDVVVINQRQSVHAEIEAQQKQCDFILYTTFAKKKRGGGGGLSNILKKGGEVIGAIHIPGVSQTGITTARDTARSTGDSVSSISSILSSVKMKDEMNLKYDLFVIGSSQPRLSKTSTKKAGADEEDVITPLIEEFVNEVLKFIVMKK